MSNQKRQPRGVPIGGQFDSNEHDEANGSIGAAAETPSEIHERYERDAAETRAVIDSHIASGFLKKTAGNRPDAPDEYETGEIFVGRNADGERLFVNYRTQIPTGKRPNGSMEDPTVLVDPIRFSMQGALFAKGSRAEIGGGQNSDDLNHIVESKDAVLTPDEAKELRSLWEKNHLNDMNAGTHAQSAVIAAMPADEKGIDFYQNATARLESEGLLVDGDYKYGSQWLARSVPASDVSRTLELLSKGKATSR